jgi:crotonobetainyl-CoA:carnitine CoA-transferase CaiB-like acyl-CoA transferase
MRPLKGLTVVSLEQAVAAPFATRQLADLGARVIKVERPGSGDFARSYDTTVKGMASHFVWLNRSKESLALDLKKPESRAIIERLLAAGDVFVQNLAPGATDRLGLGADDLRRRFPRLIICGISGYGSTGPYRDKKAYDLLIQAEAGLLSITGTEDTPAKVGVSIADIAGGMYAYAGILAALLARTRTNGGTVFEVSLLDALAEWMGYPAYYADYSGAAPPRSGAAHATIAPYGPFADREGEFVYLAVQNDSEWRRFCEMVLDRPGLASDPMFDSNSNRVRHRAELDVAIHAAFSTRSTAEIIERLDAAQVANARMNTVVEFLKHPQLASRDRWRTIESPVGPLRALLPPVTLDGDAAVMGPIPAVGQHTDAILHELGYDEETIAELHASGAAFDAKGA